MRIVMMGTGRFAEPTFEAVLAGPHPVVGLMTNPDRPSGRDREMLRGMKRIALARGVPVLQPESINTTEGAAALRELKPDLLVVAAYGQILSKDVLSTATQGGINVHASLLPKYRGAAPIAWAIYHGETQTGVTIIKMSVALDAGDMLAQEAINIGAEETAGELEERLAVLGARLATQVIEQVEKGTARGSKQDPAQVTKAPKLKKEHGLIQWERPARAICNQVRAMQPWPTAYTYWRRPGQEPIRLILQKAVARDSKPLEAGQVVIEENTRLLVGASENSAVEVLELQPAGKRRMSAAEFVRGNRPGPDDRFIALSE
jgi:methionyl-tRNA formyltransferase